MVIDGSLKKMKNIETIDINKIRLVAKGFR
jgi:hypothetical protein